MSSVGQDNVVFFMDGDTLVVTDPKAEPPIPKAKPAKSPDILQQALAELNSAPATQTIGKAIATHPTPGSQDNLLPPATTAFSYDDHGSLLDQLASVVAVDTNTSAVGNVQQANPQIKPDDVITVYQLSDGTMQITPEHAQRLNVSRKSTRTVSGSFLPTPQPVMKLPDFTPIRKAPTTSVVLVPSGTPQTPIACIVTPHVQPTVRANVQKDVTLRRATRPTIIGRKVNTQLTAAIKPVMTPSVVKTGRSNVRAHPLILPKPAPPATPPVAPAPTVVTHASSTIQLFQRGSTYHSPQPLTDEQLSSVVKAVKLTKGERQAHQKETQIVVDKSANSQVVYTVLYPESPKLKDTIKGLDSSDEDSYSDDCPSPPPSTSPRAKRYYPHEILPKALIKKRMTVGRKRGRPTLEEASKTVEKPEVHSKKLRKEFGLTMSQLQVVEKDIVPDREIKNDERKQVATLEHDDIEIMKPPAPSLTKSGRLSKPAGYHASPAAAVKLTPTKPRPEENRPKRKLQVSDRYRCRVCNKVYLGDRKMNRHVKLYPSHGPLLAKPESPQPSISQVVKKIPELSIPVIPMARTQLEELVKNLDAELVLDVVSKKMFDNFSMWALESKKLSNIQEKGLKRLTKLLDDMEVVMGELKKVVDSCITDTKLADNATPLMLGEHLQAALNLHEGPWYLEQPKHIPEEYQKLLGVQSLVVMSPRSDSITNLLHGDEDNSNSMMSTSSDREQSVGAQIILERNLEMDEDTQDGSVKKSADSEFEDSNKPDSVESGDGEEEEEEFDENSNQSTSNHQSVESRKEMKSIDPVGNHDEPEQASAVQQDGSSHSLEREIESLHPFPTIEAPRTTTVFQHQTPLPSFSSIMGRGPPKTASGTTDNNARVVSSSFINNDMTNVGFGPGANQILNRSLSQPEGSHCVSSMASGDVLSQSPASVPATNAADLHDVLNENQSSVPVTCAASLSDILNPDMEELHSALTAHLENNGPSMAADHRVDISDLLKTEEEAAGGHDATSSPYPGPSNLESMSHASGPPSVDHRHISGPPSVDPHAAYVSGPPSVGAQSHLSCPPSVDYHAHHLSGPPSVEPMASHHMPETHANFDDCPDHRSGPPSVEQQMSHASRLSEPSGVDHMSNPPSVGPPPRHLQDSTMMDNRGEKQMADFAGVVASALESSCTGLSNMSRPPSVGASPCSTSRPPSVDQRGHTQSGPPSVATSSNHPSGPPSVEVCYQPTSDLANVTLTAHMRSTDRKTDLATFTDDGGHDRDKSVPETAHALSIAKSSGGEEAILNSAQSFEQKFSLSSSANDMANSLTDDRNHGTLLPDSFRMDQSESVQLNSNLGGDEPFRLHLEDSIPVSSCRQHQPSKPQSMESTPLGDVFSAPVQVNTAAAPANAGVTTTIVAKEKAASDFVDTIINTPALTSDTDVTFTDHSKERRDLLSSNETSSSANFLSALDSVLQDSAEFPFPSALDSDSMQNLKTPEKLMHSIPPSSMMKPKAALTTDSNSLNRTNFLGALQPATCLTTSSASSSLAAVTSSTSNDLALSSNISESVSSSSSCVPSDLHDLSVLRQSASSTDLHQQGHLQSDGEALSSLLDEITEVAERSPNQRDAPRSRENAGVNAEDMPDIV